MDWSLHDSDGERLPPDEELRRREECLEALDREFPTEWYTPVTDFSVTLEGREETYSAGVSRVRRGHPALDAKPEFFTPLGRNGHSRHREWPGFEPGTGEMNDAA
jgi:hypothetical protein